MGERNKIDYARQAVCYAIEQLLPSDRVSITIFDDQVQTLVSNTPANNKASLTRLVQQVQPGGSTALYADEDLLTAMATSGDGNYYYIASPEQLPTIFEQELQGLAATLGTIVRLRLEPQGEMVVADIFNDLSVDNQG